MEVITRHDGGGTGSLLVWNIHPIGDFYSLGIIFRSSAIDSFVLFGSALPDIASEAWFL